MCGDKGKGCFGVVVDELFWFYFIIEFVDVGDKIVV